MTSQRYDLPAGHEAHDPRARVAIDLGAESCRVSLLRWYGSEPRIELLLRIPNAPVHRGGGLFWPLDDLMQGIDEGLRKAAEVATEGIASIGVDGWAVDYVRLDPTGAPIGPPRCYRDERTIASKASIDAIADPQWMFACTGAQPHRFNTLYQLAADRAEGVDIRLPWLCIPEYLLYYLGGRAVAEYTNATHTGFVDLQTGSWSDAVLDRVGVCRDSLPTLVRPGTCIGKLRGPLAELHALHDTNLIAPACHDTASALAGIPTDMENAAYICSGTWSLVGALIPRPIQTQAALTSGFTNQGAAGSGVCFHSNVNGMWILKQCMNTWNRAGRTASVEDLIARAELCHASSVDVAEPSLLLDGDMPAKLNRQLRIAGHQEIPDVPGNEGQFSRLIFNSLADQYGRTIDSLRTLTGRDFTRIHILGGGSQNRLLTKLASERTGLAVERGHVESSTVGNIAVQLASAQSAGGIVTKSAIVSCARRISTSQR